MTSHTTRQSISLGYCEGSSDKVYYARIDEMIPGTFCVNFSYGRRGGTLNHGTKTITPVTLPQAQKIYNKLVDDKKAKGYTEIGGVAPRGVTPTAAATSAPATPRVLPQLLNPVEEKELYKLFANPEFVMQTKMDGKRILLHRGMRGVYATNRKGLECGIPESLHEQMLQHRRGGSFILDGELVGDQYHVFDILERGAEDIRDKPYGERLTELTDFIAGMPSRSDQCVHLVKTWSAVAQKTSGFVTCRADKEEGVVFKHRGKPYSAGRPASGGDQLKFKFVATASVRVLGHNPDKRSVRMEVTDGVGWQEVGNVTIGGAIPIPPVGSVIEVRYLYAFKGGSLFQPIYLGERDDLDADDCKVSQLKYKQEA
jgi:bifunctional non-homologous end joining protein LigD